MKKAWVLYLILALALVGILDAGYLTYEHFSDVIPPCTVGAFADCGKVLKSEYAVVYGIPLAVLGVLHYVGLFTMTLLLKFLNKRIFLNIILVMTFLGISFSAYFVYLQLGVIHAICLYCMGSALNSLVLFPLSVYFYKKYGKEYTTETTR